MTDDLQTAFDLEARAAAMAAPLDRISLRDHVVQAEIGAFEAERGVLQRLRFDIVVEVRPPAAAGDPAFADDVDRILSYDRLSEAVEAALAAERLALLETLADRVAARILREPQAERVFLRVQKLDRGPGDLGVEVVRVRTDARPPDATGFPSLDLVLVGLDSASDLPALIGRHAGAGGPLLLCAIPSAAPPPAANAVARRRIALLALDQAAWALASHDPRLTVAGSRTELDWALRRGHPAVWAPARMVLDARGAFEAIDVPTLAGWLARQLGAEAPTRLGDACRSGLPSPLPQGAP